MAKSDSRFGYRADSNRESHDLSAPFGFTAAPGMLLPCFADVATPGDTYYIKHDLEFLRTLPMLAPAMVDVKVHLESFFVPFQMIYQPIENTLFSLTELQSTLYTPTQLQNNNLPLWNYSYIVSNINNSLAHSQARFDAFRLADMLALNADNFAEDDNHSSRFKWNPSVFPWQLLAYHTIFQYYYRLDDKSAFDNGISNFDSYYYVTGSGNQVNYLQLHQRPWHFDYFTSMYRSPIVSDASMQSILVDKSYSSLFNNAQSTHSIGMNGLSVSSNNDATAFSSDIYKTFNADNVQGALSTAMIRQMFANEKLAMITGRARKTYDSQVLAHFGVEVPHDPKHDIAFIGEDTYTLKIGEVTSLASTTGAGLGDLAGKGWSQGKSKGHKFVSPCHGVVMTIFSVEPIKRYYGGFDRINAMTNAFDIPTKEFDRLGNMPMFRYEAGENAGSGVVTATDIIGWKERYYYNKRRHPRVTLAFQNGQTSRGFNNYGAYMLTSTPFGAYTSTNNNTARPDLESRFYIDRNCMDGMMLTPYINTWQNGLKGEETSENWNATPWLAYSRDPFIVDLDLKVKKVSWMSKDGEPIYNF